MIIQIEGRHIKVTEALQEHVNKRLGHLNKYFDGLHDVRVILTVEESRRTMAEVVCGVVRGQQLVAKATHEDLYQAIDEAVHKLREHLKRYKERIRERKRGGVKTATAEGAPAEDAAAEDVTAESS